MARFLLSVRGMGRTFALAIALLAGGGAAARAVEVRSELTVGREFVFLTNDLAVEVADGQLALGGGITMVSDYMIERYGAQALVEYHGDHFSAGVAATFGPRQAGRGWASIDPHAEAQLASGRWRFHGEGGVLLRRIDAAASHSLVSLDQLQLHGAADVTLDERWRAGLFALYSFYGPDPAAPSLRSLDLGLAVTLAGKPERWAVGGLVARRAARQVWLEVGAAGVSYADGSGAAVVPRAVVRLGAWRGVTIGASCEMVVGVGAAAGEPLREIGGLELEYER
ncbi:MAG: hypothetical protein JWM53_644 [bacterium]|nr:hypothetical protein [bacterium]